ncbi:hypothetical protein NAI50_10075, partial [Francisella tularensis subsp. holarctica]|uniref:hypothetical protein n=1 Tax=Francisella tularensis TaxID=263 RepID=UPI002381AFD9
MLFNRSGVFSSWLGVGCGCVACFTVNTLFDLFLIVHRVASSFVLFVAFAPVFRRCSFYDCL